MTRPDERLIAVRKVAAYELVRKHKLVGWSVRVSSAIKHCAACRYKSKTITLSKYMMLDYTDFEFRDTVLHEIAHAIVGYEARHGPVWKAKCREIGCTGEVTGRAFRVPQPAKPPQPAAKRNPEHASLAYLFEKVRTYVSKVEFDTPEQLRVLIDRLRRDDVFDDVPLATYRRAIEYVERGIAAQVERLGQFPGLRKPYGDCDWHQSCDEGTITGLARTWVTRSPDMQAVLLHLLTMVRGYPSIAVEYRSR
jgi:hypothetical protein